MKAILEFNLPEDTEDFNLASNANNYHCVLVEFKERLRWLRKSEVTENGSDMLENIRIIFNEILEDNISIDI